MLCEMSFKKIVILIFDKILILRIPQLEKRVKMREYVHKWWCFLRKIMGV